MKSKILVPSLVAVITAITSSASAQNHDIHRTAFDSGSGHSSSPRYTHKGALGAWVPDAMQSAQYTMQAMHPAMPTAINSPGVPRLNITLAGDSVRISWPLDAAEFVLDGTAALNGASPWTEWTGLYQNHAHERFVLVPLTQARRFYRLRQP